MKLINSKLAEKAVRRLDSAQERSEPGLFESMGEVFDPKYEDMIIKKISHGRR